MSYDRYYAEWFPAFTNNNAVEPRRHSAGALLKTKKSIDQTLFPYETFF